MEEAGVSFVCPLVAVFTAVLEGVVAGGLGNNPPPPNSPVPPDAAVDVVVVDVVPPPGVLVVDVSAGLAGKPNKPWAPEGAAPVPLGGCAKTRGRKG